MTKNFLLFLFLLSGILSTTSLNAQQTDSNKVDTIPKNLERKAPPPPPPPPPPPKEQEIFRVVEEMPRFPGCEGKGSKAEIKKCAERKLTEFIYKNLRYPQVARDNKVEGMCVVQFTVEPNGSVSDVVLVRDIGAGCGEESLRVVNLMNEEGIKWVPGPARGRPVRARFTLPIKFKLQ